MALLNITIGKGLQTLKNNKRVVFKVAPCKCESKNIILICDTLDGEYFNGKIQCNKCGDSVTTIVGYKETDLTLLIRWNMSQ